MGAILPHSHVGHCSHRGRRGGHCNNRLNNEHSVGKCGRRIQRKIANHLGRCTHDAVVNTNAAGRGKRLHQYPCFTYLMPHARQGTPQCTSHTVVTADGGSSSSSLQVVGQDDACAFGRNGSMASAFQDRHCARTPASRARHVAARISCAATGVAACGNTHTISMCDGFEPLVICGGAAAHTWFHTSSTRRTHAASTMCCDALHHTMCNTSLLPQLLCRM